ncbi:MAG TPA: hypothetical protein VOA64_12365 [Candidatus Dormibacteraeota bacterium]|nr:hypothetical protein [Candidatus Dormibacteraeota bacterium]
MRNKSLQQSAVRKYTLLFRYLQAFACRRGLHFLRQLDLPALREFRVEWRDGPLSSLKKLERLRTFFRFAHESKWIIENPALKLKSPHHAQRQTLPYTYEEMVRILAALNPYIEQTAPRGKESANRLRALVLLLRYSGMRIGDVVKLSTDQINGNKLFMYTQKSGVPVNVVLPDFVVRVIATIPKFTKKHFF